MNCVYHPSQPLAITGGFMSADGPVLETLTDMTAASIDHNSLSPREYLLARLAAMIAVDAPPLSWYATAPAIEESGLTAEDIQGVMIAVAPVVGGPRVMAAGGHILRALGIAIAVTEAEMEAEIGQE
jgi:alkylhydroperoxidase/carboxymuconolactone decarboxylase family protein YurZ